MERALLDDLYSVSPRRAFQRALADISNDANSYGLLLDRANELDAQQILAVLTAKLHDGVERHDNPFIEQLARIFASANWDRHVHYLLEAFGHAGKIDPLAWLDLTQRLRGRLPNWVWYRFVDQVRGGKIFTALNSLRPHGGSPTEPRTAFCKNIEKDRPEPLVVPLLDNPDNEIAALPYALSLPLNVVLWLHENLPHVVTLESVKSVVPGKVASHEPWQPPFPPWIGRYAVERLHDVHCDDPEAQAIFDWLVEVEHSPAELLDAALVRFKRAFLESKWHPHLGSALNTGKAWKQSPLARDIVEFCVETNKGFPPTTITAALHHAKDDESRASIVRGLHDVTASVLVEHAERAIEAADWKKTERVLRALACLDPGSFISGPVHHLRKIAELPSEIGRLVEVCERIFKRPGGRSPTVEDHGEAFRELYGSGQ